MPPDHPQYDESGLGSAPRRFNEMWKNRVDDSLPEERLRLLPGVDPEVALDRLRFAKDHLAQCVRKYEMAHNGEELFALPFSEYPELAQTEKDIKLFDQLSDRGVLKCRGAFPALDGLVAIRRGFE